MLIHIACVFLPKSNWLTAFIWGTTNRFRLAASSKIAAGAGLTIVGVSWSSGGGGPCHSAAQGLGVSGVLERGMRVGILVTMPPRHGHSTSRTRVRRGAFPGTQHGEVCQPLRGIANAHGRPGREIVPVVRRVARHVSHRRAKLRAFRAHVVPVIFPIRIRSKSAQKRDGRSLYGSGSLPYRPPRCGGGETGTEIQYL